MSTESHKRYCQTLDLKEDEALVSNYQKCDPGATSAQKWTLMERIFYLYE